MKNNTNLIIIAVVVLLLLGGGFYFLSMNKGTTPGETIMEENTNNTEGTVNNAMPAEGNSAVTEMLAEDPNAKVFEITGQNFSFSVTDMRVKKGDTVKIIFKSVDGMHDWALDEFSVKTAQLQSGEEETVTFVADKAGIFEYYCSVGQHRANGMVGNLTVEE